MAENGTIPSASTAPDIDPDEILSALDTDTRSYLQLLVSGAGKGLKGRGSDLQETYARLGPTNRDLARVNTAVARRKGNLKNLINKYGLLTTELATKDRQIVRLVRSSNAVFESLATQDNQIASAVNKLPGTLDTTSDTLEKVDTFGQRLTPALQSLRPPIRKLDPANKAVLPLVREATPQIRDQIRPVHPHRHALHPRPGHGRQGPQRRRAGPDDLVQQAQPAVQHRRLQPGRRRGPDRQPAGRTATVRRATCTGWPGPPRTPTRCSARPTRWARCAGSRWAA